MPCDTRLKRGQTIQQRAKEVREVVSFLDELIRKNRVQVKVGPKGGITFIGMTDSEKDGVTDACAYRRLMVTGSSLTKAAIARAEQIAGRSVDRAALAAGVHSHDGGHSWHDHKG
jgi:hypothetical protein